MSPQFLPGQVTPLTPTTPTQKNYKATPEQGALLYLKESSLSKYSQASSETKKS